MGGTYTGPYAYWRVQDGVVWTKAGPVAIVCAVTAVFSSMARNRNTNLRSFLQNKFKLYKQVKKIRKKEQSTIAKQVTQNDLSL